MTRLFAATVFAFLITLSLVASARPDGFDAAVSTYNSHQYAQALAQFQSVIKSSPNDASSHYYLALCYQSLAQQKAAQQEYNWVYAHSTDQTLRYYSYQALQRLNQWGAHREVAGNAFTSVPANKPQANKPDLSKPSSVMIGGQNIPKGSEFCPFRNAPH